MRLTIIRRCIFLKLAIVEANLRNLNGDSEEEQTKEVPKRLFSDISISHLIQIMKY